MTEIGCDLYRWFNDEGELLYVGISLNAFVRATQHKQNQTWWRQASVMKRQRYETRKEAEEAERLAIITERPKHNIIYSRHSPASLDVVAKVENGPRRIARNLEWQLTVLCPYCNNCEITPRNCERLKPDFENLHVEYTPCRRCHKRYVSESDGYGPFNYASLLAESEWHVRGKLPNTPLEGVFAHFRDADGEWLHGQIIGRAGSRSRHLLVQLYEWPSGKRLDRVTCTFEDLSDRQLSTTQETWWKMGAELHRHAPIAPTFVLTNPDGTVEKVWRTDHNMATVKQWRDQFILEVKSWPDWGNPARRGCSCDSCGREANRYYGKVYLDPQNMYTYLCGECDRYGDRLVARYASCDAA